MLHRNASGTVPCRSDESPLPDVTFLAVAIRGADEAHHIAGSFVTAQLLAGSTALELFVLRTGSCAKEIQCYIFKIRRYQVCPYELANSVDYCKRLSMEQFC